AVVVLVDGRAAREAAFPAGLGATDCDLYKEFAKRGGQPFAACDAEIPEGLQRRGVGTLVGGPLLPCGGRKPVGMALFGWRSIFAPTEEDRTCLTLVGESIAEALSSAYSRPHPGGSNGDARGDGEPTMESNGGERPHDEAGAACPAAE